MKQQAQGQAIDRIIVDAKHVVEVRQVGAGTSRHYYPMYRRNVHVAWSYYKGTNGWLWLANKQSAINYIRHSTTR